MKTLAVLVVVATTGTGTLLILWWVALINGLVGYQPWTVTLTFNRYNEHWAEGIMFHVFGAIVLVGWLRLARKLFR